MIGFGIKLSARPDEHGLVPKKLGFAPVDRYVGVLSESENEAIRLTRKIARSDESLLMERVLTASEIKLYRLQSNEPQLLPKEFSPR